MGHLAPFTKRKGENPGLAHYLIVSGKKMHMCQYCTYISNQNNDLYTPLELITRIDRSLVYFTCPVGRDLCFIGVPCNFVKQNMASL